MIVGQGRLFVLQIQGWFHMKIIVSRRGFYFEYKTSGILIIGIPPGQTGGGHFFCGPNWVVVVVVVVVAKGPILANPHPRSQG